MNVKEIRGLLGQKGQYTKGEIENYSELSSGKIKAALIYKRADLFMPLFELLDDKDTSVGSEVEKRTSSLENKFFTHALGESLNSSVEEIIKASIHAKIFGLSVVELFIDEAGNFAFEFIPREYYSFEADTLYLKKGKSKFKPTEPKFYIIKHKPVLLKTLWIAYAKHFVLSHYLKFTEFLGVPPLIGNAHSSDAETIDQMAQAFKNLKSGAYAVLGPEDIVKVLEGRGSQSDFMEFVRYADSEIAKVINGASLGSNIAKSGSYAQSISHEANRAEITKGDVKFATRICNFLFSKISKIPLLNIQIEKDEDLFKRAQMLQILDGIGYKISADDIAVEFDLPLPKPKAQNIRTFSKNAKELPSDAIDSHLSSKEFEKRLKEQEDEILEVIEGLCKECNTYEEVYELLIQNYATMEFAKLDEMMFKAIANNFIAGAVDGQ